MTANGAVQLKEELHNLKSVERPKVVLAIKEAREKGDLKENAEYHAAREEQSFMEGRIKDIEAKLSNAHIIDIRSMPVSTKVIFGSTVKLKDLDADKTISYKLVGQDEADIKKNLVFFKSPIGKAFIGKNKGEMVTVSTPSGERNFEILNVEYI